jgi:PAS domain S-box-containing protein
MQNGGYPMSAAATQIQPVDTAASAIKPKILLVDDTPENLISLEAALDSLDADLVSAHSGKEALRFLLEDNFAAILLDVKMPDMDGFETAELIRSRPRSRNTPILFLTGYRNEEHLFRGYDLGAVDFLFKPIVPEVLRSKVTVFIELSRNAELLRRQAAALSEQTAALEKTERQFRSLLEAAPDAMVICREDGGIVLVNSRTEALFGYGREELLGRQMGLLVPDWKYEHPDTEFGVPAAESFGTAYELYALRRDGTRFPVEISLSPLEIDEGLLITTALRDITERIRAEQERAAAEEQVRSLNAHLAELNGHLEERVLARTEELMRSNDELEQFAYVASHDLREPLRTVSLYTQLLAVEHGRSLDEQAGRYMNYITENANRMECMIRDILDFSRLEARHGERFVRTSCESALDEAISNLRAPIAESGAVIDRGGLPYVFGDPVQIVRLFQNLIVNSVRYRSPERAPRIHVCAARAESRWTFSVIDNGIGIEPQYAEKVFGIFKRLNSRENSGTGMGLAICRKIVIRHGGRIWLEPTPGGGATFRFTMAAVDF